MSILKKLFIGLFICMLSIFPVFLSSCFITDMIMGSDTAASIEIKPVEENGNGKITEEEFVALIENEDFLETFNTFYYPDSIVKDARSVDSDQSILYVILETVEEFDEVEDYYKNKKVQSIWSRDFIYQKSMAKLQEEFIEGDEDIPISKFTFSSKDRDRVVDILVKDLDTGRTQIMITCWNLQ
ncbi:MAG: hypothetical protein MUP02_06475 [Actinobacteria bacterium]|nr:hypothetical protein [Actinomycetota bacterium]